MRPVFYAMSHRQNIKEPVDKELKATWGKASGGCRCFVPVVHTRIALIARQIINSLLQEKEWKRYNVKYNVVVLSR